MTMDEAKEIARLIEVIDELNRARREHAELGDKSDVPFFDDLDVPHDVFIVMLDAGVAYAAKRLAELGVTA